MKQKLSGKAGRLTKSRAQPAPSFVVYCPSVAPVGTVALHHTSKSSSQESSLAWVGLGVALLGTVPCWVSRMAKRGPLKKPQYSRVEKRLEGAMENTGPWTHDSGQ